MRTWTFALAGLLAACAAAQPAGVYSRDDVRVYLKPDGAASVQAYSVDRQSRIFSQGRWRRLQDGRIVVDLATERPQRIVLLLSGDQLVAVQWDRAVWGNGGPGVLYRVRY